MIRRIAPVLSLCALLLTTACTFALDEFFDSNGVKIHYIVEGQGEPVVLIHGFTASIQPQWGLPGIIKALSKDYQVIALDNRGHGRSDKPHDPKQYGAEMINDVIRLMDHVKIQKAHIVGYSMGGFMTNYLIMTHPERAITATLGGAGWSKPNDERLDFMTELADSLDAGKGIGPLIVRLTPANRPQPSEEQIDAINQMLMLTNDAKALAACIRGMRGLAVTEEKLRANKVPTLALIGEIDPLKVGVDELAEVMPGLKVEVIEGADHMTAFVRPKFINDLKDFLASHSQTPAAAAAGGR
ncbi:MAG: alpha/beta hydrolase [Planctomycetia bacterium]|nr:alpha/beta hydrolase [Planctomycetia bacterium]